MKMDIRDSDRPIIFKVTLSQDEWNALDAMAQATGYPKGTLIRNFINQLPRLENHNVRAARQ